MYGREGDSDSQLESSLVYQQLAHLLYRWYWGVVRSKGVTAGVVSGHPWGLPLLWFVELYPWKWRLNWWSYEQ